MDMQIVTAGIIRKDGRVLIAKRKKGDEGADRWEFPGGLLKPRETARQCLKRELKEELGIDAEIGECVGQNQFHYRDSDFGLMFFEVTGFSGEVTLREHQEIRWVTPQELPDYDFPEPDRFMIDKLAAARPAARKTRGG